MPKPRLVNKLVNRLGPPPSSGAPLLDSYLTNSIGFWGLQKLTSDSVYSGNLARHRVNTGGQPEYDIPVGSDGLLIDTAQMLSDAGSNSSFWRSLYNQNGSGLYDQGQSTAANQFQAINAGTLITTDTGKPCLKGLGDSGGASMLSGGILGGLAGPGTVMSVISTRGANSQLVWATNGLAEYGHPGGALATFSVLGKGDTGTANLVSTFAPDQAADELFVLAWRMDGTASPGELYINGVKYTYTPTPDNCGDFGTPSRFDIGYSAGTGFHIDELTELCVWDGAKDEADIIAIQEDQMSRWGISA